MAERCGVRVVIETGAVPLYPGARAAAEAGARTGGDARNREYLAGHARAPRPRPTLEALVHRSRRPPAGCWPRSTRRRSTTFVGVGFTRIGEVVEGAAAVVLR